MRSDVFVAESRIVSVRAVVGPGRNTTGPTVASKRHGRCRGRAFCGRCARPGRRRPGRRGTNPGGRRRAWPVVGRPRRRGGGAPRRHGPPGRGRVHRPECNGGSRCRPDVRARTAGRGGVGPPEVGRHVLAPDGGHRPSVRPGPGPRRARRLRRPGGRGAARPAPRGPVPRPRAAWRPRPRACAPRWSTLSPARAGRPTPA